MINLVFFPILSLLGILLYWLGFARYRYAWSILIILNLILAFDSFLYIILYKITFIFNGGE